jgi:hypothetical protein
MKTLILVLSLLITLVCFSCEDKEGDPSAAEIKKGDRVEYKLTGPETVKYATIDFRPIKMYHYTNSTGTLIQGGDASPSSLSQSFIATHDNQPIILQLMGYPEFSSTVINAQILVNGKVIREGAIGNGVISISLTVGQK